MRQCVELGLHRKPLTERNRHNQALHTRIFWDCYVHDRYSSATLGRPYAIDDGDIEVDPPDFEYLTPSARPVSGKLTSFGFLVGLRRITSRMHTEFLAFKHVQHLPTHASVTIAGRIYTQLQAFLSELQDWRLRGPSSSIPRSLFERVEWFDFVVEKDWLALIRDAISQLLAAKVHIFRELYQQCLQSSVKVIDTYAAMFQRGYITWTRSYFQIIFNAGLSIMYCLSSLGAGALREDSVDHFVGAKAAEASLKSCKLVLSAFEREMPDTRAFVLVFEALRQRFSGAKSASQPNTRAETPNEQVSDPDPALPQSGYHVASGDPQSSLETSFYRAAPSSQVHFNGTTLATDPVTLRDAEVLEGTAGSQALLQDDFLTSFPFQEFDMYDGNLFDNDILEHMQTGLGQYAWGNLLDTNSVWNQWSADNRATGNQYMDHTFY
jgi:hypothetical protein